MERSGHESSRRTDAFEFPWEFKKMNRGAAENAADFRGEFVDSSPTAAASFFPIRPFSTPSQRFSQRTPLLCVSMKSFLMRRPWPPLCALQRARRH
jgi:hypothetical protein